MTVESHEEADIAGAASPETLYRHLERRLMPGELVFWIGQPDCRRMFRLGWPWLATGPVMVIGSIAIGGLLIYAGQVAPGCWRYPASVFVFLGTAGIVLMGLWCANFPRQAARKSKSMVYAITNHRAVISDMVDNSLFAYGPEDLREVRMRNGGRELSDLLFERDFSYGPGRQPVGAFIGIPNGQDVLALLRALAWAGVEPDDRGRWVPKKFACGSAQGNRIGIISSSRAEIGPTWSAKLLVICGLGVTTGCFGMLRWAIQEREWLAVALAGVVGGVFLPVSLLWILPPAWVLDRQMGQARRRGLPFGRPGTGSLRLSDILALQIIEDHHDCEVNLVLPGTADGPARRMTLVERESEGRLSLRKEAIALAEFLGVPLLDHTQED